MMFVNSPWQNPLRYSPTPITYQAPIANPLPAPGTVYNPPKQTAPIANPLPATGTVYNPPKQVAPIANPLPATPTLSIIQHFFNGLFGSRFV